MSLASGRDTFEVYVPVIVVDKVTEARGVDDRQAQSYSILLDIYLNRVRVRKAQYISRGVDLPALMLSIATVFGRSALGGKGCFSGYSVVLNSVLIKVDFPSPDSPMSVVLV